MKNPTTCPVCQGRKVSKKFDVKDFFFTQEKFSVWECSDCSVLFTHPQPPKELLGKYYDTPDYLSHNTKENGLLGKVYASLRNYNIKGKYKVIARHISRGRLLDIGCGSGELLHYFTKKGWEGMGIEPNETARKFARDSYGLSIEGAEELKRLPEKSFDVISMWHVLEHVPDVNERMNRVSRLLKDQGIAVIALPNPESYDAAYYKDYWAAYDVPRHLYHFSQSAFKKLAAKHHFTIVEVLPLKLDAYYVSLLSERYRENRLPFLRAVYRGWVSNSKAKKNGNYSSRIFILRKN